MWRAFFIATGVTALLMGLECLAIEKAILANKPDPNAGMFATVQARPKEITPPDWAPWSLLSAGAITVLYSFTLPKKVAGH